MVTIYKRILPKVLLFYVGITLLLIPNTLFISSIFRTLIEALGLCFMFSGIVWFFADRAFWLFSERTERITNKVLEFLSGPLTREINYLKIISGEEIIKFLRKSIENPEPKIIIEYSSIGRWTYDFIDYFSFQYIPNNIKFLITGYRPDLLENYKKQEIEGIIQQLLKLKNNKNITIEIRTCTVPSSNTSILGINNLSLILPFDPKGKYLIYIDIKPYTDIFDSYQYNFNDIWEKGNILGE